MKTLCNFSVTCRQIYAEAAGLAFKLNRFDFPSCKALEDFVSELSPAQKDAITDIGFRSAFVAQNRRTQVVHVDSRVLDLPRVCIDLAGLKHIRLCGYVDEDVAEVRKVINDLRNVLAEQKGRASAIEVVYDNWSRVGGTLAVQ